MFVLAGIASKKRVISVVMTVIVSLKSDLMIKLKTQLIQS